MADSVVGFFRPYFLEKIDDSADLCVFYNFDVTYAYIDVKTQDIMLRKRLTGCSMCT